MHHSRPARHASWPLAVYRPNVTELQRKALQDLNDERFHILRQIDRATSPRFQGDFDAHLEEVLRDSSKSLDRCVWLYDPESGTAPWSSPLSDKAHREYDETEINIGLGEHSLVLRVERLSAIRRMIGSDPSFVRTLATQLPNMFDSYLTSQAARWIDELEEAIYDLDLHPRASLEYLNSRLITILPKLRIFPSLPTDVAQIIVPVAGESGLLSILASTGPEAGSMVRLDDSVVGLLIRPDGTVRRDFILGDPREEPLASVYKGFYTNVTSELAIPLVVGERVIAGLNLERSEPIQFTPRDYAFIKRLLPRLARLVMALQRRLQSDDHARMSLVSTQSKYWETVGSLFRHDIRVPLAGVGTALQNMQKRAAFAQEDLAAGRLLEARPHIDWILETIPGARERVSHQGELIDRFREEFSDYLRFEPFDVIDALEAALRVFNKRLASTLNAPSVVVEKSIDRSKLESISYCSPLLKIFFFNVLDNSLYWLTKEPRSEPPRIRVSARNFTLNGPVPALNRMLSVRIEDNGPGAPDEVVHRLNDDVPHVVSFRDGGDGYALSSFRAYAESLGGSLRVESRLGEYFAVELTLRESARQ